MKYLRLLCLCFLLLGSVGQVSANTTPYPSEQHEGNPWGQDDGNPSNEDGADCASEECEDDPGEEDPEPTPCPPEECDSNSGGARNPGILDLPEPPSNR